MKNTILFFILIASSTAYTQNDSIQKERHEVINAIYEGGNTEKYGKAKLDRNFFPFFGLGLIISDLETVDNLFGHCIDRDTQELFSYSDILSQEEITELRNQISWFGIYKKLNPKLLSKKIKVSNDKNNTHHAVTLPLVYKNKAIVYRTNKENQETLFVLVKENNEWEVRCAKVIYVRFDD